MVIRVQKILQYRKLSNHCMIFVSKIKQPTSKFQNCQPVMEILSCLKMIKSVLQLVVISKACLDLKLLSFALNSTWIAWFIFFPFQILANIWSIFMSRKVVDMQWNIQQQIVKITNAQHNVNYCIGKQFPHYTNSTLT